MDMPCPCCGSWGACVREGYGEAGTGAAPSQSSKSIRLQHHFAAQSRSEYIAHLILHWSTFTAQIMMILPSGPVQADATDPRADELDSVP